ncbi:MAG: DUF2807 domain-containing protein [Chloroflexota bacterium]|nr:MAG: DUF2807 domain-containing protein [Chloroflexota bacterium]
MNKKILLPLALIVLLLSACTVVRGSGDVETETRAVSSFDQVSLSGQGELILTQGDQESLEIEAEDNIIAVLESDVRGNTLYIGAQDRTTIRPTEPVRFYLTMAEISGLEVSGVGTIIADNVVTDRLALDVSGAGDIDIDSLSADSLTVDISGAGGVNMAGQAANQVIDISGSGEYQAADLESETADIEVSGAGEATVWASQTLNVDISGSGSVDYYGNPAVTQDISGVGELNNLGER